MVDEQDLKEVRFDIDPGVEPDVVGSILELEKSFEPQSFDVIWSSHVLEHLYAHETFPTLRQFHRTLKLDGFALIMSPDIEAVAHFIVEQGIAAVAYNSPAGPIRPLDMLYGHSRAIEEGHVHMAHHTGFTAERLGNLLLMAGFPTVSVATENFEVCALALMPEANDAAIKTTLLENGFNFQEVPA
jgi:predicted SAM-dependent methyltransferase